MLKNFSVSIHHLISLEAGKLYLESYHCFSWTWKNNIVFHFGIVVVHFLIRKLHLNAWMRLILLPRYIHLDIPNLLRRFTFLYHNLIFVILLFSQKIGAINCMVRKLDGRLIGFNTDYIGAISTIENGLKGWMINWFEQYFFAVVLKLFFSFIFYRFEWCNSSWYLTFSR